MCRDKKKKNNNSKLCYFTFFSLFKGRKTAFVAWIIRNVLIQNVCMLQHANLSMVSSSYWTCVMSKAYTALKRVRHSLVSLIQDLWCVNLWMDVHVICWRSVRAGQGLHPLLKLYAPSWWSNRLTVMSFFFSFPVILFFLYFFFFFLLWISVDGTFFPGPCGFFFHPLQIGVLNSCCVWWGKPGGWRAARASARCAPPALLRVFLLPRYMCNIVQKCPLTRLPSRRQADRQTQTEGWIRIFGWNKHICERKKQKWIRD